MYLDIEALKKSLSNQGLDYYKLKGSVEKEPTGVLVTIWPLELKFSQKRATLAYKSVIDIRKFCFALNN